MKSIFDEIKERVSIFDMCDLAGVQYSTKNASHKVFCPFHDDTATKSGYLYHDTDIMRCFTCAKSWDVIDFWAQHNEWYRDEKQEHLDVGKAIADLKERYNIEVIQPSWEQKYHQLKKTERKPQGYAGYDHASRVKLRDYYAWKLQLELRAVPKEARAGKVVQAMAVWDELDAVDLGLDSWKLDLSQWTETARNLL